MKWFLVPVLWVLAAVITAGVLWRLWRGKPIVLHGRWTPRLVRMVAILLVILGVGADKTDAAPLPMGEKKTKPGEELPPTITAETLQKWASLSQRNSAWSHLKQTYMLRALLPANQFGDGGQSIESLTAHLPARLRDLLAGDLKAIETGKPAPTPSARELVAVLDEAETNGFIDPWLIAHLWRKTGLADGAERKDLIALMARLHRQARLANTLTQSRAVIRPFMEPPAVWRSKAGRPTQPRPELLAALKLQELQEQMSLLNTLKKNYPTATAGTWETEGLASLNVTAGSSSVTIIRAGEGQMPRTSGAILLGRLDLLETAPGDRPAKLLHSILGEIEVPAGKLVSVWDLPRFLNAKSRATVLKLVESALAGGEKEAAQLEKMLPLAQSFIRDGLRATPRAAGAARLRLILTQFDDVPSSPATPPEATIPFGSGRNPFHDDFPRR